MTTTVTFRTSPENKARIENLAKRTRRSAAFYYNVLLDEHLEDLEDVYDAIQVREDVRAGKEKTYSLESVAEELGYED